jgi:hypothetical protein
MVSCPFETQAQAWWKYGPWLVSVQATELALTKAPVVGLLTLQCCKYQLDPELGWVISS